MSDMTTGNVPATSCGSCGNSIPYDTPEFNVVHGQVPYPFDTGIGLCRECGGEDPPLGVTRKMVKEMTEAQARKYWGANMCMIAEARFDIVRGQLGAVNQAKWDAHNFSTKVYTVVALMEKGVTL